MNEVEENDPDIQAVRTADNDNVETGQLGIVEGSDEERGSGIESESDSPYDENQFEDPEDIEQSGTREYQRETGLENIGTENVEEEIRFERNETQSSSEENSDNERESESDWDSIDEYDTSSEDDSFESYTSESELDSLDESLSSTDSFGELSIVKMSSEKYIPKFDDKRENFEVFMTKWIAHGMRAKFSTVNTAEKHVEMPEDGIYTENMTKRGKKLLKMNERALADLRTAFASAWRCEAIIEKTCTNHEPGDPTDSLKKNKWPHGRIWMVLAELNKAYRGSSRLDRIQLDREKAKIVLNPGEHPDEQFHRLYLLRREFKYKSCQPTTDELIAQLINGSRAPYTVPYTQKLIELDSEEDGIIVLEKLQELGNELYTAHNAASGADKGQEMSLIGTDNRDMWSSKMLCFWCGSKGHKAYNCYKRKNGEPQTYFGPGSEGVKNLTIKSANANGNGNSGNGNGKTTGTNPLKCRICGKKHKNPDKGCFERPENAAKRPPGWVSALTDEKRKELNLASVQTIQARQNSPSELFLMSIGRSDREITNEERKLYQIEQDVLSGKVERFPDNWDLLYNDNVFVFDTGATETCSGSNRGAVNITRSESSTMTQNGYEIGQRQQGDIPVEKLDKHGRHCYNDVLRKVQFSEQNRFNLFAVNQMLEEGFEARGDSTNGWSLCKGNRVIRFDIKITTTNSCVWVGYFRRRGIGTEIAANAFSSAGTKMSINTAHVLLGHPDEDKTREAAKARGWILTRGNLKRCEHCAKGKAKRKNIPSTEEHIKVDKPAEKLFLDISSLKNPKNKDPNDKTPFVAKPHMRLIHDEYSSCRFIRWFERKSDMVEPTCELLYNWKTKGLQCKVLRMDGAGENKMLEERMKSEAWKFPTQVEYTARDSPWQNSPAETGIFTICNKARALCSCANIPKKYRYRVFPLACETSCSLDWLVVEEKEGVKKTRIEWFSGKIPRFVNYMRTFGEAGVVKTNTDTSSKVYDRGVTCMMGGYCPNREGDCYQMYDPINNVLYYTRDVVWLRRMYFPKVNEVGRLELDWYETFSEEFHYGKSGRRPRSESNKELQKSILGRGPGTNEEKRVTFADENRDKATVSEESENENDRSEDRDEEDDIAGADRTDNDSEPDEEDNDQEEIEMEPRRSSRTVKSTQREEYEYPSMKKKTKSLAAFAKRWTPAEKRFLKRMEELGELHLLNVNLPSEEAASNELVLVGATGTNFGNTAELRVLNYKESMEDPRREEFVEGMDKEHAKITKYGVVIEEDVDNLQPEDEVIDSTWANKLKPNGDIRCRIAARGFRQTDGLNYDSTDTAAPVICDISIRISLILMCMAGWLAWIVDVEGAFLNGCFQNGERLFMKVPDGFQKYYPSYVVLRLLRTLYGLKQAAMQFWREARKAMKSTAMKANKADPCLFYKWIDGQLLLMLLWVDDFCIMGPDRLVQDHRNALKSLFDCKDVGEMDEYVGCHVERDKLNRTLRLTQPVKIKRFEDEYDTSMIRGIPKTPAEGGSILKKEGDGPDDIVLDKEQQKQYRSATAILLHMMRWSRVEVQNAVRDCSRYMTEARRSHMKALQRIMKYCIGTPNRGLTLAPKGAWNGTKNHEFEVKGMSDSEYAADETRYSVNGWSTWLCGAPVTCRSKMMPVIALSVMEAELYAAVQCAQDMMYIWRVMSCMDLKVKLPMMLEIDNKGCVDFCNNWSVAGRTRHIEVKQYFLRDLKELGILKVVWKSGEEMTSDIFTKNLHGPLFEKHGSKLYGEDEYYKAAISQEVDTDAKEMTLFAVRAHAEYCSYWNRLIA